MQKTSLYAIFLLSLGLSISLGSCSYTLTSTQGVKVSSVQIQEIKLGRTTETDLIKLLGSPSKKERTRSGSERLLYESTDVKSLTFIGGFKAEGFLDKEEDEIFEIILKGGVVENYRFINP